jgi:hypothetical protein
LQPRTATILSEGQSEGLTLYTIAALLFGFDTAVISGAIDQVELQFALSGPMKGWIVGSALAGCSLGSAGVLPIRNALVDVQRGLAGIP